jgi:hypothetical protein
MLITKNGLGNRGLKSFDPDLTDKRETLGMPDGLDRQVDIQFWPVKMIG